MPPRSRPTSTIGPPVSKSKAPSSSKAPLSKSTTTKPPSTSAGPSTTEKPASKRPASKRALETTVIENAPEPVPSAIHAEDVDMKDVEIPNGKVNGVAKVNGHGNGDGDGPSRPVKKGRVAELVNGDEKKKGRRSSVGPPLILNIPQPPEPADPHHALFVFGTGDMGQFGLGPDELDEIGRPKLHSWFEEQIEEGKLSRDGKEGSGGLEAVACGGMHTLAIDEAGQVRSWGINDGAALGRQTADVPDPNNPGSMIPNEDLETYPYVVETLVKEGFRAVKVDAGDSVSVALSEKGELRAWGSFKSNEGILGFDGVPGHSAFQFTPMSIPAFSKLKFVDISCGSNHVLALTTTGHVWVWGNGQQNELGRRIIERRKVHGLHPERLGLRNIVKISTGTFHSFAVDRNGIVWAWGLNTFKQTGVSPNRGGNEDIISTPTQVDILSPENHNGAKVIEIAGGEHHTIFLFDSGEVWGCGRQDANQIGISKDHPAQEGLKERRDEILEGKNKKVEAAGKKLKDVKSEEERQEAEIELASAQANVRAALDEYIPEPVRIYFPPIPESYEIVPPFPQFPEVQKINNPIKHISAGTRHNLAVSESGHVYSWGLGLNAQLGLGNQESAEVPTLVRSKSLRPYTALYPSAGGQHCVLLAREGDPHVK